MLQTVKTQRLIPGFRGQAVAPHDAFGLLGLRVRLGLARDPTFGFPWSWPTVASLEPGLQIGSASAIYAGVANPLRAHGDRGFWMGDSRAERDPFMVATRALATMATGHFSRTSIARLAVDADRKSGRFVEGSAANVYRTLHGVYKFGEEEANRRTLSFDDWLSHMTAPFAEFVAGSPALRFTSALSRRANTSTRFAADHIACPAAVDRRFPRLNASLDGVAQEAKAGDGEAHIKGYDALVRLLELHLARNVAAMSGKLGSVLILPDLPGEDKADAHRKRRLRQARMGTALSLMPFIARYAYDRAALRHPILNYYFEKWLVGAGLDVAWSEFTQALDPFVALPPDLAHLVGDLAEVAGKAKGWQDASVTFALMPVEWIDALLTPEGGSRRIETRSLMSNQARIPGRYRPKRTNLEGAKLFQAVFEHARRLFSLLRSSAAGDESTAGGAYLRFGTAIGFISPPGATLEASLVADPVVVTNGLGVASAPPSVPQLALTKRALPAAASGSPLLVAHTGSRMASRVAESGGDVAPLGSPGSEKAGVALATSSFMDPGFVMVETTPLDDDLVLAGVAVNPRAYVGLKPAGGASLRVDAGADQRDGDDPVRGLVASLTGLRDDGTIDQILRDLGNDVAIFPNTTAEWARRLLMTREDFERVVLENPQHWAHLFKVVAPLVGAGPGLVEPAEMSPLAATSDVLAMIAESVSVDLANRPISAWVGFEDYEPLTAWQPLEDATLRDGEPVDVMAYVLRITATQEAEAYAPVTH